MRSVFWRIFATFWLAIILVAFLSILLGRTLNQDAWILRQHPSVSNLAAQWVSLYESQGIDDAIKLLIDRQKEYGLDVQVLNESGSALITRPMRHRLHRMMPPPPESSNSRSFRQPWRQLSEEYTSPTTGSTFLFIYRIPRLELAMWQRESVWFPVIALTITFIVLTLLSLLLTLTITKPLNKLREAVKALGRTAYQKNSLAKLANRKDEFGTLAKDFSLMGEHLQTLIDSQRQLLRDVSHELRSPLARLKITLALLERAKIEEKAALSSRLTLECDRLEALIEEILTLARLDSVPNNKTTFLLKLSLDKLVEDAKFNAPQQQLAISISHNLTIYGWPDHFERALDNLIRNALRFNPIGMPIEVNAWQQDDMIHLTIRDHGVGVPEEILGKLTEPFYRVPNQESKGYGLGLSITKRIIESHGGQLILTNHPEQGFIAEISLPAY